METFVVVPCLNEEDGLAATCASLGFGQGGEPIGRLVLVDNGSTDGTSSVMRRVRDASPAGQVLLVQEPRRGYVSARRAGMAAVLERTRLDQVPLASTLVVQADADTVYLPGYVDALVTACSGQRGLLLEGCALTSREFNTQFHEFTALCREVDVPMERWFAAETEQVVIDDKVCAFLLADYCDWGEHQEDLGPDGQPIHAETTRLFMRARAKGRVWRVQVEAAQALPSRRKLLTQAPGYFASSGFPRDAAWMSAWGQHDPASAFLVSPRTRASLDRLIRSRQRHQLALFALLPALFCLGAREVPAAFLALATQLREAAAGQSSGWLLGRLLALADEEEGALSTILSAAV